MQRAVLGREANDRENRRQAHPRLSTACGQADGRLHALAGRPHAPSRLFRLVFSLRSANGYFLPAIPLRLPAPHGLAEAALSRSGGTPLRPLKTSQPGSEGSGTATTAPNRDRPPEEAAERSRRPSLERRLRGNPVRRSEGHRSYHSRGSKFKLYIPQFVVPPTKWLPSGDENFFPVSGGRNRTPTSARRALARGVDAPLVG